MIGYVVDFNVLSGYVVDVVVSSGCNVDFNMLSVLNGYIVDFNILRALVDCYFDMTHRSIS